MKQTLKFLIVGAFALLISVPAALAQTPEYSTLPIDEPTEVSGTILQPGVYSIRVLPTLADRNRVQITSPDRKTIFVSALTVPHQLEPNEEIPNATFIFYPAGEGKPRALRTWFAADPASDGGHDFIYEESRATQLARLASAPVISYRGEETDLHVVKPDATVEAYTVTPVTTTTTTTTLVTEAPVAVAVEPAPVEPAPMMSQSVDTTEDRPMEMPRTAGNEPLLALLGLLSVGAAVGLRAARQG